MMTSIVLGSLAAAAPALAQVVDNPTVSDVRLGRHPDWTRVVIDLNAPADYQLIKADKGRRLIIELPDTEWSQGAEQVQGLGLVTQVTRFKRASGAGLRIVLDLKEEGQVARTFLMPPGAGRPYRLVVDVMPADLNNIAPSAGGAQDGQPPQGAEKLPLVATPDQTIEPDSTVTATLTPDEASAPLASVPPQQQPGASADTQKKTPDSGAPVMMAADGGPSPNAPSALPPPISLEGLRQQWSGNIEGEVRLFPQNDPRKSNMDASVAVELQYEASWDNGMQSITVVPFARLDEEDSDRTHFDLREAKWVGVFGHLEVRIGIDRVFWGVAESEHLVNIINQVDGVEDVDEEDFLGQPMVSLSWSQDWGTVTAYFLPYFRERTFPGYRGRPGAVRVARELTQYGTSNEPWRTDWAVRYAHATGPFDIGLSYFHGLGRRPTFIPAMVGSEPVLIPRYDPIDQASVDLQGTFGALLLKFEGITVDGQTGPWGNRYYAAVGGFEYTVFNAFGSSDLGFLSEYLWDDRGSLAPVPFDDDLFVGMRWSGNDTASTSVLAGGIFDLKGNGVAANVETSQRLWQRWRLTMDARLFFNIAPTDPLYPYAHDDFVQVRLGRFF